MQSHNFTLRGISPQVMNLLKKEAKELKTSVNSLILNILEEGMGVEKRSKRTVYHDLDNLAGTWSVCEANEFDEKTKGFEVIDKELW